MNNRYFFRHLVLAVVALPIAGLGSCQRIGYSFRSAAAARVQSEAVATAAVRVAAVADASVTAASADPVRPNAGPTGRRNASPKLPGRSIIKSAAARPVQVLGLPIQKALAQGRSVTASARSVLKPSPEQHESKGIAVLLAVLLGMFGAHLFYLGYSRRALTYLITTLVCIELILIAIPVANSAAFGSGLGGAFVGIFILVVGVGGIALTYLKALFDAIRILTSSLP